MKTPLDNLLTYEQWDLIADSYIPILVLILVARWLYGVSKQQYRQIFGNFYRFVSLLTAAYGMMVIDNIYKIWPSFHADYSTHTAVALVLGISLTSGYAIRSKTVLAVGGSLFSYGLLMWFQQYHTVIDMMTTSLFIGVLFALQTIIVSQFVKKRALSIY